MKKKLFECVGGNQFKVVKPPLQEVFNTSRPWSGLVTEPGTQDIPVESLPVTLDDLLDPRKTEYLANPSQAEDMEYVKELKKTSKIVAARKVPGYNSDFRKSSNPGDFMYEVVTSYVNEKGETWGMLFGVSADGKHIQLFQS